MATNRKAARRRPIAQSRITSKGQATIPTAVRRKLGLRPGDRVIFEESERGEIVVHKAERLDIEFLTALEGTLSEWNSPADDLAYGDL